MQINIYIFFFICPLFNSAHKCDRCLTDWDASAASRSGYWPKGHGNNELQSGSGTEQRSTERLQQEQPGRLDSNQGMGEQRKGRSDIHFRTPVSVVVKRHIIQIYGAITLVHRRDAEWNNKWRRPLTIRVESFEVGRWSGWLVLIYYKGIFMLFELPSISHVNQNGILIRQFIPTHMHTLITHVKLIANTYEESTVGDDYYIFCCCFNVLATKILV